MNRFKNSIKRSIPIIFALGLCTFTYTACTSTEDDDLLGNWSDTNEPFKGISRSGAACFVIGDNAYVGTGIDAEKENLSDFYCYNIDNSWTQIADFPGTARYSATAFAADDMGYVGTGYDGDNYYNDFYQYNPESNTWTQKKDFGGAARLGAIGFGINGKGYMGTGYNKYYLNDIWEYDPSADTWTEKVTKGSKRKFAQVFVINNIAYIVGGYNPSLVYDFWSFDPATDTWTELRKIKNSSDDSYDDDYSSIARYSGVAMVADGKGYLAAGTSSSLTNTVWEYDPTSDLWQEKTNLEANVRNDAVGFTLNNRMFITTGGYGTSKYEDMWEFKPNETYDSEN